MPELGFVFPNDAHPAWSLMIVLYPYITGLVAGAFVVSALYYVFDLQVFKPVARLALVTSLCFCSFATLPLLLHLHHPERCLQVMITPSTTSAIAGFGFIYSAYMLVLIVEIWLVFRPAIVERAKPESGSGKLYWLLALGVTEISDRARSIDRWLIRALAIVGIPIACVLTGYVGFLFGSVKANPWWSTALMPVIFLLSAVLSGIAVVLLLYLGTCRWRGVTPEADCIRSLSRYLWIFLVGAVTLEGMELLHMAYEAGGEWHIISTLLTEHLAISYGVIQVLIGAVIPFFLLLVAFTPKFPARLLAYVSGLASVLVLVQVFAMRWNVVIGGQLFSKSHRGFIEFPIHWLGREGILAAAVIMVLPLIALWGAAKIVPLWQEPKSQTQPQATPK